ncbi:hypothetical protein BGZ76_003585 [Entomortierella beljakovae]|nr:hypothetical protein BGZ76_003585 [Entomortierella beljakovae]
MEKTNATRLRYKGSASSSHKRKRKRSHSPSNSHSHESHSHRHHHQHGHGRSRTRSRSRSRSKSPKRHHHHHHDRHRSKRRDSRSPHRSVHKNTKDQPEYTTSFVIDDEEGKDFDYSDYNDVDDDDEDLKRNIAYLERKEKEAEESCRLEQEKDSWTNRLFDEFANDSPFEYHSDRFSAQSSYYRGGHGSSGSATHIDNLSDADYTAYMRQGMGRSHQDKKDKEWQEWVQDQEQVRYQKAKEEQKRKDEKKSQRRREQKERERLEAEMKGESQFLMDDVNNDTPANKLRRKVLVEKARLTYENGWGKLIESNNIINNGGNNVGNNNKDDNNGKDTNQQRYLSMKDIPLPPLNKTQEMISNEMTTSQSSISLFEFLFHGTTAEQLETRKQLLRREQLRFHPDKFKQRFGSRLPPEKSSDNDDDNNNNNNNSNSNSHNSSEGSGEREKILEMVDRVARALNEMNEALRK